MELLEGGQLHQIAKEREETGRSFSEYEASQIMRGIISAVDYIHQLGIVHRDLKPGKNNFNKTENILLTNKNDFSGIKIADFGLSAKYNLNSVIRLD